MNIVLCVGWVDVGCICVHVCVVYVCVGCVVCVVYVNCVCVCCTLPNYPSNLSEMSFLGMQT